MSSKEYTIAELQTGVVQVWEIEKLQRLKSLIDGEIIQRLVAGRRKRKESRSKRSA